MLTRQKFYLVTVLVVLIISIISSLTGCGKKNTSLSKNNSNLTEIDYLPVPQSDYSQVTNMLLKGQADMIGRVDTPTEVQNLKNTKDIKVISSEKGSSTLSCVFFNLRRSPNDDQTFRTAIAQAVNREYITSNLLNGVAIPCTTFVPPISDDWTNKQAIAPGFNTINATKTLDSAGYRFDKTLKSRINPKTGQPLHMTVLTPLKDTSPVLWDIGYTLTYYINGLGIEADHVALPDYLFQLRAMETRDFDILVQDITLSKAPFGLYSLLYSSRDTDGTDAFSGIHDNNLDILLEQLWSSLDLPAAQKAAQEVQSKLADILPYVPVCSVPVFSAVNEQWVGFVNMPGTGISNLWSYESIKSTGKTTNNALRLIVSGEIDNLNPLTASTSGEWSILSQIFSPLFYSDPQSLQDTPVLAKKWDVQPWTTPSGSKGTKITFHLIDGVTWQDGVPFTAQDIKFGIDYIVSKQVPGFEDISNLVDNVQTPDNLTVEIYLKDSGYRYIYDFAWLTFLPQHIWQNVDDYHSFSPWNEINPQNKELTKLVGQGPFVLKPGNISNGIRLVKNESAVQVKP